MGVLDNLMGGVEEAAEAGIEQVYLVSAQAVNPGNDEAKARFDNWIFEEPSGDGGDMVYWLEFTGDDPDMPQANLHVKIRDDFFNNAAGDFDGDQALFKASYIAGLKRIAPM